MGTASSEDVKMFKCQNCGGNFTGEICPYCGWELSMAKDTPEPQPVSVEAVADERKNSVGQTCKVVAGILMAVMVIGSIAIGGTVGTSYRGDAALGWGIFLGGSLSGIFSGMILWGIGEIIQLLQKLLEK